jgi:uncharacterized membrane protein
LINQKVIEFFEASLELALLLWFLYRMKAGFAYMPLLDQPSPDES